MIRPQLLECIPIKTEILYLQCESIDDLVDKAENNKTFHRFSCEFKTYSPPDTIVKMKGVISVAELGRIFHHSDKTLERILMDLFHGFNRNEYEIYMNIEEIYTSDIRKPVELEKET